MRICFYNDHPYWGQLADNGGSRTIILSCEALRRCGHEAAIVARKDRFTWFRHPRVIASIPSNADAVIAVSISDVPLVMQKAPNTAVKAYWARPIETWQMNSQRIYEVLKAFAKSGGIILCNSEWQIRKLAKHGINAKIQYAGLDLDEWHNLRLRPEKITCGALYSDRASKQWNVFASFMNKAKGLRFVAFGLGKPKEGLDYYVENPTHEELKKLYSSCHVWIATSKMEGFHNPPTEAALCGCLVVCSDNPHNGCGDYANSETAETYATSDGLVSLMDNLDYSKVPKMQELLRTKIGSRETNMAKLVEALK